MELPATPAAAALPPPRKPHQKRRDRQHKKRRLSCQAAADKQAALLGVLATELTVEQHALQQSEKILSEQSGQACSMQPNGFSGSASGGGGHMFSGARPTNTQAVLHVGRAIEIFMFGSFKGGDAFYRGNITAVDEVDAMKVRVTHVATEWGTLSSPTASPLELMRHAPPSACWPNGRKQTPVSSAQKARRSAAAPSADTARPRQPPQLRPPLPPHLRNASPAAPRRRGLDG